MDATTAFLPSKAELAEKSKKEVDSARLLPQLLIACAANLAAFSLGTSIGWSAPASPQLLNSTLNLTTTEVSTIGSIMNLGGTLGAVSGGWVIDRFGRRNAFLIITPICFMGYLLMGTAVNLVMLLIGRTLTGIAGGLTSIVAPVYSGEIATPKYRGFLGSVFSLFLVSGILFVYILGAFLDWWMTSLICVLFPVLGFILTYMFVPETPTYLISKNDEVGAEKSLVRLRGRKCVAEYEMLINGKKGETREIGFRWIDLVRKPAFRPTSICVILMIFQQLCGINAAMYNLTSIFSAAGGSLDSSIQVIVIGTVQLVTTVVGSLVVDRAGRRVLLSVSGLVMGIAMTGLGTYFYLLSIGSEATPSLSWLPLVSLALFSVFFSIGFGPVVWIVMGEILPQHVKGVASAIVSGCSWGFAFVTTLTYEPIVELMGQAGAFYLYGAFSFMSVVYVLLCVPETTGRTLDEIQKYFE